MADAPQLAAGPRLRQVAGMKIVYYILAIIVLILTGWIYIATEPMSTSWCTSYNVPSLTDTMIHTTIIPMGILTAIGITLMGYLQSLPSEPIDKKRYCPYCGKELDKR
jgi:hypothetical protein